MQIELCFLFYKMLYVPYKIDNDRVSAECIVHALGIISLKLFFLLLLTGFFKYLSDYSTQKKKRKKKSEAQIQNA